jgi:hypothetical protein
MVYAGRKPGSHTATKVKGFLPKKEYDLRGRVKFPIGGMVARCNAAHAKPASNS